MKIVILDGYMENPGDLSWDGFSALGDVAYYDRSQKEEVIARIGDAEAIIINKIIVDKELMDRCRHLQYVGLTATGYDNVDIEEAKKHGIAVTNVPAYGTDTVAQHAIAMLLEICNRIGHHNDVVKKEHRWAKNGNWSFWDYSLIELSNKTMGIIGFGRIGQAVGRIAHALGMRVQFYNPSIRCNLDPSFCQVDLDTLFRSSDVISLHCPLTKENKEMINKETLAKMKPSAILINTARGKLINEEDLAYALQHHQIYAAALDVSYHEPMREDHPLMACENCIITPHIAWAAKEARARIMDTSVTNLKAFIEGRIENRIV